MHSRLLRLVETLSRPGSFIPIFLLAAGLLVAVTAVDFPGSLPALAEITDARILDLSFFYQADEVYRRLEFIGPQGRQIYLQLLWAFDVAIPVSYGVAVSTGMHLAWRDWYASHPCSRYLFLIPLLAAILDYSENIAITFLLLHYPLRYPVVADLAGYLTAAKTLTIYPAAVLALLGGLKQGFAWLLQRERRV